MVWWPSFQTDQFLGCLLSFFVKFLSDCINYRYSGPAPPQALAICDHLRISSDVPFLCSEAAMQQICEKIDLIDLTEDTIDVEEQAIEAQLLALKKIPGLGSCIDIELTLVRIGFFFGNHYPSRSGRKGCTPLARVPYITPPPLLRADSYIDEGSWDHRNRLKVYRGLHLISNRQFTRGANHSSKFTFTATELVSYTDFAALTVICNTLALKRVYLKKVPAYCITLLKQCRIMVSSSSIVHASRANELWS